MKERDRQAKTETETSFRALWIQLLNSKSTLRGFGYCQPDTPASSVASRHSRSGLCSLSQQEEFLAAHAAFSRN